MLPIATAVNEARDEDVEGQRAGDVPARSRERPAAGARWLLATTGMRRGEVLGLRWADIDLDTGRLTITRTLITTDVERRRARNGLGHAEDRQGPSTNSAGPDDRVGPCAHRSRQLQERLAAGSAYEDGDLVCCLEDGRPLHPKTFSYYFGRHVRRLELPKIRLHDLRHTHATLALRAGVHPRIVQERLGHANVSITLDTYSHVDLDMQSIAAARVAAR